jgi:tetratricopeptide (TPR) repeat protein
MNRSSALGTPALLALTLLATSLWDPANADVVSLLPQTSPIPQAAKDQLRRHESPVLDEAIKLFRSGDTEHSVQKLEELRKTDISLPPTDLVLVWLLLADRKVPEAKHKLEELSARQPQDAQVALTLGQVAVSENRWADAAAHLERAATMPLPNAWNEQQRKSFAWTVLDLSASVFEQQQRWADAQRMLSAVRQLAPQDPHVIIRLARTHYRMNSPDEANKLLAEVEKLERGATPAAILRAELAFEAGRMDEAAKAIEEAEQVHAKNPLTQLWKADWRLFNHDPQGALAALDQAKELGAQASDYLLPRGQAMLMKGDYASAVDVLQSAREELGNLTDSRRQATATHLLAMALACRDSKTVPQQAMDLAQRNALEFSADPAMVGLLGWLCSRRGERAEAQLLLNRALDLSPHITADLSFYLADFYARDPQHLKEARTFLTAALEGTQGVFLMRGKAIELSKKLKQ